MNAMENVSESPARYVQAYLEEKRRIIDEAVAAFLTRYPEPLREMVRYAAMGGKRLRGSIVLSVFERLSTGSSSGPSWEDAVDLAVAVELVHAYSLVHDDLPCMDDDDFRRGKPTLHRKFGEAMAVLTGDALLTAAFEAGLGDGHLPGERLAARIKACSALSAAAGASGMVAGQVLDMKAKGNLLGIETVRKIYSLKTGALFGAAAEIGGLLAAAEPHLVDAVSSWGREFGYAFQVADDIEDAESGEKSGDDTLVAETSLRQAVEEGVSALRRAVDHLRGIGEQGEPWFVRELSRVYLGRLEDIIKAT